MLTNVPVYSTQNNTHFVNIYVESEDGTFRRTQNEPLRLLRDDIAGISMSQGELVSQHYDRHERQWASATVTYHYGRPQSFYQFLREKVAQNRFFVFSKPVLSGHLIKFDVHELKLKPSMSQRKISILKEKYLEALELWSKDEYEAKKELEYQKTQKIKLVRVNPESRKHPGGTTSPQNHQSQNHPPQTPDRVSEAAESKKKIVALDNADEKRQQELLARQLQAKVSAQLEQKVPGDKQHVVKPDIAPQASNPFGGKTKSHFLRRFLFHRQ
jgi:hypothetical protein